MGVTAARKKKRVAFIKGTRHAIDKKRREALVDLDKTLAWIDEESANGWDDGYEPADLLGHVANDCDGLKRAITTFKHDPVRAAQLKDAVVTLYKANADVKNSYGFDIEDHLRIARFDPSLADLWRDYADEFGLTDSYREFPDIAAITPEEQRSVGVLSKSGKVYTGAMMGSRDSYPFAEVNENKTDITYFIGCFEGNKDALLERLDNSYPARPENGEDATEAQKEHLIVSMTTQTEDGEEDDDVKHRADYLNFIAESERMLLPVYDAVPPATGNTVAVDHVVARSPSANPSVRLDPPI